MNRRLAAALASFLLAGIAVPGKADETPTSDTICQNATAPMVEYFKKIKDPDTPLAVAIDDAQYVVDAYDQCAQEKLSVNAIEEGQYANLWSARWNFVVGQWQHLGGNDDLARTAFATTVKLSQAIVDWKPMQQNYYHSNDENIGGGSIHNAYSNGTSKYRDDATKVRDAAQKALDALGKPAGPAASPAPAASAAPHG